MNDVLTDTSEEGLAMLEYNALKKFIRQPYDPKFPRVQAKFYPDIKPLLSNKSVDVVFKAVNDVINTEQEHNWQIYRSDDKEHVVEFIATTRLLRFKDDCIVVVKPQSGSGSLKGFLASPFSGPACRHSSLCAS
jgi:hypothetical protein